MHRNTFVARTRELGRLQGFLERALDGQGQVAFVVGEAGSGKTALVTEFARRAEAAHGHLVVAIGNCNAQTGIGDPYLPFREILAQLTGDVEARLARGAITAENARRLQELVHWSCDALLRLGPDLINILVPGTALVARVGAFALDHTALPDKLKRLAEGKATGPVGTALDQSHIFEQTTSVLKALAAKRPLVLVLDDLQWADSASISLLFHLGRRIGESNILVLGAYREEEVGLGRGGERHPLEKVLAECKRYFGDVWVDLDQAEKDEAGQFVDALLDLEPNRLGPSFRRAFVQHTGGHPLFAVELLRHMQEQGDLEKDAGGCWIEASSLDWDALPARVEGVIEERIGRLEAEQQETLTVGSVEGEEFTAEVIARVRAVDERGLIHKLSYELDRQHHLVEAQGMRRRDGQPLSSYRFRHNLFQKYLYHRLDAARRAYLHEDVGSALEALYRDQAPEIAVQLGRHFDEAGLTEKAIYYLRLAAEHAMRVSANIEAIDHLTRALVLLQTLPATAERDQLELPLQIGLAAATAIAHGPLPSVQAALDRARELCRDTTCSVQLVPVLRQLYLHHHSRAEHRVAYALAKELLGLVQQTDDPVSRVMAYGALGQTQVQLGDIAAGRDTLERGLAYYNPERFRDLAYLYGEEFGVTASAYLGVALFLLGYPDQGLGRMRKALDVTEALAHPHVMAMALYGATFLHLLRREGQPAGVLAERGITLCDAKGIPLWRALLSINHAHALALQGRLREGIAEGLQSLAAYRAMGARLFVPFLLAQVAEMHLLAGQVEEGLAVVAEVQLAMDDTGEHKVEAELHRLRAELLASQGREADAETDWQRALAVARRQQTRSFELRATLGLCRLWHSQGKRDEARRMLTDIYGWFTEGFETPDLQEARALLEQLAQPI